MDVTDEHWMSNFAGQGFRLFDIYSSDLFYYLFIIFYPLTSYRVVHVKAGWQKIRYSNKAFGTFSNFG